MELIKKVAIIGFKERGQALAKLINTNFPEIEVSAFTLSDKIISVVNNHKHSDYFNDDLDFKNLTITTDLKGTVSGAQLIIVAATRKNITALYPHIVSNVNIDASILILGRGNYPGTNISVPREVMRMAQSNFNIKTVQWIPSDIRALSLWQGQLQMLSLVGTSEKWNMRIRHLLKNPSLRIYTTTDFDGAEVYNSFLELSQLVAGIVHELGYDKIIGASVVTRLVKEISIFNKVYGGKLETFSSLSILPSLMLDTFNQTNENYLIAQDIIKKGKRSLGVEKIRDLFDSLLFFQEKGEQLGVPMPMINVLYGLVKRDITAKEAIERFINSDVPFENSKGVKND